MPRGIIKKIIRASFSIPESVSSHERTPAREGYGIISAQDGREVFFIHTAVPGNGFADLRQGMPVEFILEEGPIGLATSVALEPATEAIPTG